MTKQKEIREGIENLLATFDGLGSFTEELLDYLHSQGVVILKQGQGFPDNALVGSAVESLI